MGCDSSRLQGAPGTAGLTPCPRACQVVQSPWSPGWAGASASLVPGTTSGFFPSRTSGVAERREDGVLGGICAGFALAASRGGAGAREPPPPHHVLAPRSNIVRPRWTMTTAASGAATRRRPRGKATRPTESARAAGGCRKPAGAPSWLALETWKSPC